MVHVLECIGRIEEDSAPGRETVFGSHFDVDFESVWNVVTRDPRSVAVRHAHHSGPFKRERLTVKPKKRHSKAKICHGLAAASSCKCSM